MSLNSFLPFTKMSGTGNDFIIIDHRVPQIPVADHPAFVKEICRRKFSVGADGVIFIEQSATADFSWRFYNDDGSVAEMCGNGARCAARYAYRSKIAGKNMRFETVAGTIEATISGDEQVSVQMTRPFDFRLDLRITLGGEERQMYFVNSGVPHAVLFIDEEDVPVVEWGREVRQSALFQPAGTNVNFVKVMESGELLVRTYERGVEDETMACGTGATAAGIIASLLKKTQPPVAVVTSGGDRLTIRCDLIDGPAAENVFLEGPADIIYEGKLTTDSLRYVKTT